jgi:hypothetical protein
MLIKRIKELNVKIILVKIFAHILLLILIIHKLNYVNRKIIFVSLIIVIIIDMMNTPVMKNQLILLDGFKMIREIQDVKFAKGTQFPN